MATRQEKYPDTNTFHFYNANPKNRYTTDCVIRAIATATDVPYNTVVMEMARIHCETGYDDGSAKGIELLLERYGWVKCKQPRKSDNTKFTGKEFCKRTLANKVIANIGGNHTVAIISGKVWDTWDSTDGCIGNYWIKK